MKRLFCFLLIPLVLIACSTEESPKEQPNDNAAAPPASNVKNVILLIGDGMGLSQVSSSYYFGNTKEPSFNRFPFIGLVKTSSAKEKVTDSAAGATAYACGIKTYNGAIAMDTNGKSVQTIIELVEPKGLATGLIATSSITHATPASFFAHAPYRKMEDSIAQQMPTSGVDFFAGGGLKFFANRKDSMNVIAELQANGFTVDTTALGNNLDPAKRYGYILADEGLSSKLDGRGNFLVEATELALDYLSKQDNGFFLMVESSQIDWEGHAQNVEGVVQEVRDFDLAIEAALNFAEKDGETLVIVTADHETGGFTLSPPLIRRRYDYRKIEGSFYEGAGQLPSAAHTATLIPVFAYGPDAEDFAGIYENNDVFHKIVDAAGW